MERKISTPGNWVKLRFFPQRSLSPNFINPCQINIPFYTPRNRRPRFSHIFREYIKRPQGLKQVQKSRNWSKIKVYQSSLEWRWRSRQKQSNKNFVLWKKGYFRIYTSQKTFTRSPLFIYSQTKMSVKTTTVFSNLK